MNTFQSSECHTDVTSYDFSELWGIRLSQSNRTLKNTTENFLCRAILPLARIYHTDRVFTRETLQGQCSFDTMNGGCKSMDGNQYEQLFASKSYFSRV